MKTKQIPASPTVKRSKRGRRSKRLTRRGQWPQVRERHLADGTCAYVVDGRFLQAGVRYGERHQFATRELAEVYAAEARSTRRGAGAILLTAHERREAEQAWRELKAAGKESLLAVVRQVLEAERSAQSFPPLREFTAAFLADKEKEKASPRYMRDLTGRTKSFAAAFGDVPVNAITAEAITDWSKGAYANATTRNNTLRIVVMLLRWVATRDRLKSIRREMELTTRDIKWADEKRARPGVLSVEEVSALLSAAEQVAPEIVPALAINVFAGLRPESETCRLTWDKINFATGYIDVDPEATKCGTASERHVKLTENLRAWLAPYRMKRGPVCMDYDRYNELLLRARRKAAEILFPDDADGQEQCKLVVAWPHDALRHTYGSYTYAATEDLGATMARMGHTNPGTFLRHYRHRMTQEEGMRYLSVAPAQSGKIVPLVPAQAA